jgi:hypothetical protein
MPIYNSLFRDLLNGDITFDGTDTIKCMLVAAYTHNEAHDTRSDVSSYEVSGDGYTAGGKTLTGVVVESYGGANGAFAVNADDVSWSNSTISARGCILYKSTGDAATDPLICYMDFGETKSSTNNTFPIQWHLYGLLYGI